MCKRFCLVDMNSILDDENELNIESYERENVDKIVKFLNSQETELKLKQKVIDVLTEKNENLQVQLDNLSDRVRKLNEECDKEIEIKTEKDINYWKGIEKAHIDLHNQYLEKLIQLESYNQRLLDEIDTLESKLFDYENEELDKILLSKR